MKQRLLFFRRPDNPKAKIWEKKLRAHISKKHPNTMIVESNPTVVVVLGGDGTILEAARTWRKTSPLILGLNLGHVGLLAGARKPSEFVGAIDHLLTKQYTEATRMMIRAVVYRKDRIIHETDCLNEVTAQGLMSPTKMTISVDGHPLQYIHGSGVIVSTPTGSTAYNLSAHGPIVTPDINCMIVTELLDHHLPTPSIIIKRTKTIQIDINEVREREILVLKKTGEAVDAVLTADDMDLFPLREGDRILVSMSKHAVRFAELEESYFIKSLQAKFAFK